MGFFNDLLVALGLRRKPRPRVQPVEIKPVDTQEIKPVDTQPDPIDAGGGFQIHPGVPIAVGHGSFHNRVYSYYANAWVDPAGNTHVFAARIPQHPTLITLTPEGLISEKPFPLPFAGETEYWTWDRDGWVILPSGAQLLRINPFTQERVVLFDAGSIGRSSISQAHVSADGQAFCATVDSSLTVIRSRSGRVGAIAPIYDLDESDIDASGEYVLIKEIERQGDRVLVHNRIITVATGDERWIKKHDGAVGHSGMGDRGVIGESNMPEPGRCVQIDLDSDRRTDLFLTWNMGHVSVRRGRVLISHAERRELALMVDGTYRVVVPAGHPSIFDWNAGDYDRQVRANLSPCGRRACWIGGGALWVMEI